MTNPNPNKVVITLLDGEEINIFYAGWLAGAQRVVTQINKANGWFDSERTFGDDIALMHSEVSEALEAYRSWGTHDRTKIECARKEFQGDYGICKPEGVGSEFADVLIRLLDSCERWGVDLEFELLRKLQYNATRGHRHGGKRL